MRRILVVVCAAIVSLQTVAGRAAAQDEVRSAHDAYEMGTAAYRRGDFAEAARRLAEADELAPNAVALEAALKAVVRADDPALGMTLAERAEQRAATPELRAAMVKARDAFSARAGKLRVVCPAPRTCRASLAGKASPVGTAFWTTSGDHVVELTVDGKPELHAVRVPGGGQIDVEPEPAPAPPTPAPPRVEAPAEPTGISPAWFFVGVGVTAVLAGATIWSGADTLSIRNAYVARPTVDLENDGRSAEARTNVLLGATVATAVATTVIGAFAVRWRAGASRARAAVPSRWAW